MRRWNKLRSRKGETLTETLVAILLVGLASVVLASMISAASRMGAQALEWDTALYEAVTAVETQPDEAKTEAAYPKVQVTIGSEPAENFAVTYFSDEDGTLYSYRYEKSTGGGTP
ncbi:type II secretion system protein [Oscillibacter valericigenes]|uniref:type IV pilus modification PilV family protein n=1 Tax=Oscillibacter valericigenes TaxID=351091 RepID=UPI001F1E4573|nr:type II secretion system protein [Oscillibacter valericigenes]MCF2615672.1 type II secretion system protein [Oscillibacter valericigenes]